MKKYILYKEKYKVLSLKGGALAIKEKEARIIQKFMKNTEEKRKSEFLKSICPDSSICITFGKEKDTIIKYFNFIEFLDLINIEQISNSTANGFIRSLRYRKNNYFANAILKSSKNKTSDNLFYEYMVGLFLNKQSKYFPCFVSTYGGFMYSNEEIYNKLQNLSFDLDEIKDSIIKLNNCIIENLKMSCLNSKYMAILTESITDAKTFYEIQVKMNENDIFNILYQIYMPLYFLRTQFTHHDLHDENVLIYEPENDGYIYIHYRINENIFSIKSSYIAKIIDYGRSYYYENETNNSLFIHHELCKIKECNPSCGKDVGYEYILKNSNNYFNKNESHDLRFLYEIRQNVNYDGKLKLQNLLQKLNYNTGPENLLNETNKINNITDIYILLKEYLSSEEFINQNNKLYENKIKIGDLYISNYSEIRYEPVDNTIYENEKNKKNDLDIIKDVFNNKFNNKFNDNEKFINKIEKFEKKYDLSQKERILLDFFKIYIDCMQILTLYQSYDYISVHFNFFPNKYSSYISNFYDFIINRDNNYILDLYYDDIYHINNEFNDILVNLNINSLFYIIENFDNDFSSYTLNNNKINIIILLYKRIFNPETFILPILLTQYKEKFKKVFYKLKPLFELEQNYLEDINEIENEIKEE